MHKDKYVVIFFLNRMYKIQEIDTLNFYMKQKRLLYKPLITEKNFIPIIRDEKRTVITPQKRKTLIGKKF